MCVLVTAEDGGRKISRPSMYSSINAGDTNSSVYMVDALHQLLHAGDYRSGIDADGSIFGGGLHR